MDSGNNTLMNSESDVLIKSELDLFSVPPTTVAVQKSFWEDHRPTHAITNHGPYEFSIVGDGHYIDMSSNYVYLKIKIVKADGTAVGALGNVVDAAKGGGKEDAASEPPTHFVAPINMIGATFFKQVKMIVNGKLIFDSGTDYPFLAYMLTDLNYDRNAKKTILQTTGYHRDYETSFEHGAGQLDTFRNVGAQARCKIHKSSGSVQYTTTLRIPFASQERYLLSHLDIRLELHRASDAFVLFNGKKDTAVGQEKYKIQVEDMKFICRKVELTRNLSMAMEVQLQRTPAKYPVRRIELKNINIGVGCTTTPVNTIWHGQLPRRVIICTLPNVNYFGSYGTNPFTFSPNNITKANLIVNGQCVPYSGPIEMKFYEREELGTSLITRAYTQLYTAMGISMSSDKSNDIDMHRFIRDACYIAFDLSVDNLNDTSNWELLHTGTLSIYLEFSEAIKENGLRVLILGEFDNLITIDKLRQIQYDYAV